MFSIAANHAKRKTLRIGKPLPKPTSDPPSKH